ncbi:MAG: hypothetical protein KJZ96_15525 [Rhodocyclaceae bacterium]|nr:hypothetical protein [Rhodocyclaceae bacterium]
MSLHEEAVQALGYALSKKIPDMEGRGFIIGTSYGEIEVGADEGRTITRAVKALLERKYAHALLRCEEAAQ